MNLEVKQLENELMKSNCFIIIDWTTHSCVVIDPGSEKSGREIAFIDSNQLHLDYIILTHEHTDHTWGVNALKERYPDSKLVCSELCNKYAKKASRAYFLFYYNTHNYRYELKSADIIIYKREELLNWHNNIITFILTQGHSRGSMCIIIESMIFTGDTIMPFPPHFNNRDSNVNDWETSISRIEARLQGDTIIYPGHGKSLTLSEWMKFF